MFRRWQLLTEWKKSKRRRGLTLMELVVVMSILVALASILIPLFPNLLRRAHKASDATNSSECAKAVQLYQALYFGYPNGLDLLTDGTGFPNYLPGGTATAFGNFATPTALAPEDIAALGRAGITQVYALASTSEATANANFHPTLNPYKANTLDAAGGLIDLTVAANASKAFAVINMATAQSSNPNFLRTDYGMEINAGAGTGSIPAPKYIVLGVGARNAMVSTVMQDAPMSTPQDNGFTPATTYARTGLVFKVAGAEVQQTERARFIAAVALEDDELEPTEKDIMGYYDLVNTFNK